MSARPTRRRNDVVDLLELTLPEVADNLALDEALLLQAEAGEHGEVLRLWEWPWPAVVLGSGCKLAEDVDVDACRADGVPVLRRSSGGGTVLLGTGCLCFTLVLSLGRDEALTQIRPSYCWILERVVGALAVAGVEQAGISDLALAGRKFSGNAQQRKRHHLLHHGTILYGMDLTLVGRYLRVPARQPEYRDNRAHEAFVRNLDLARDELAARLRAAWAAHHARAAWPGDLVRRLVEEKYGRGEWTERR
jgi:lipoate-protein ligase A